MGFLDIDNATKSYGAVEVLHKVDISVQEGEFLVLVGPSGCGKSTLLNMIAGLEEITSGEIRIKDTGDERGASVEPQHRHGVPKLCSVSEHDRRAEHHFRA